MHKTLFILCLIFQNRNSGEFKDGFFNFLFNSALTAQLP